MKNPVLAVIFIAVFWVLDSSAYAQDLFSAAKQGNVAAVKKAIAAGENVNAAGADGWTALALAASSGKPEAVKALLKAGAQVNAKSVNGQTPLIAAALSGNPAVVKALLDNGADVFAVTAQGVTALDIARRSGKKPMVDMIEKHILKVNKTVAAKSSQAAEAYKAGDYAKSAGLFREAAELNQWDDFDWHFLGRSLDKMGDLTGAQAAYRKSLEIAPNGNLAERNRAALDMLQARLKTIVKDCPECPEMAVIPAGSFNMGADKGYDDELPIHKVTFGKPFAMGRTEVTQAQWKAIMDSNPSANKCDNCPVEQVNVMDAQEFIGKLNARTGQHYRLPTEAEWEYACRAGTELAFCGSDDPSRIAWFEQESSQPVASKLPNAWGLYDMNGNVWEWVQDPPHDNYNGAPSDGTVWNGDNTYRIARGGSWYSNPRYGRAAVRGKHKPDERFNDGGFRLVRELP
jgi:formylglycine-generating enzyme required for sulfatase activity